MNRHRFEEIRQLVKDGKIDTLIGQELIEHIDLMSANMLTADHCIRQLLSEVDGLRTALDRFKVI